MRLRRMALRAYPPDGHLRSACRRGKRSKATSRAKATSKAKAKAKAGKKIAAFGSSYMGLGVFSWSLDDWQAAFASKPAPTVGLSAFSWGLVGCQAAFASKLTPTGGWGVVS